MVYLLGFFIQYLIIAIFVHQNLLAVQSGDNVVACECIKESPGVSIKFEVGSWLKKNNRLYEQGAVRPINLGGSGGMLPQKILKSGGSEMPFPAFWKL